MGAFCFSGIWEKSVIETIENWSLQIGHLPCSRYRRDASGIVGPIVAVRRPHCQSGGRPSGHSRRPACRRPDRPQRDRGGPELRRSPFRREPRGFRSQGQHRPEGTGRNPGLAQIHHSSRVASSQAVAVLVEECDQLCRILGKSLATAKAAKKSAPVVESDKRLAMTNSRFSMTNSQSRSPES